MYEKIKYEKLLKKQPTKKETENEFAEKIVERMIGEYEDDD